jgi:hypothetical protein
MGYVIADLPAADIDRLEGPWGELLDHHLAAAPHVAAAPHLAAFGTARDPVDSWRVIAGNEGAVRFYRREGASDYLHTLILPVRQPLSP